ncbi:MAG: 50S ribosomal protein L6 [PS1 clade bacterium]|uniref:Large ribosomal subunit protein uL6 n=1 Tax=PS1 clade bacterium TaxID=2175152 RepID=A0A937HGP1_9PROT|nr:50S ribosomal protein L6 [PS1 clade bacterium]
MSRIGKRPVAVPEGVEINLNGHNVAAKGPKGELAVKLSDLVEVAQNDDGVTVSSVDKSQSARSHWGLSRSMVQNIVTGVSEGFSRKLELKGVGYRAQMQGKTLKLSLGFSHDIDFPVPEGIDVECPSQTEILVSGIDKQKVGQVASEIRGYRPPEPYKGKGVHYQGEYVFRKEGKKK